jgi:hypothetical protein
MGEVFLKLQKEEFSPCSRLETKTKQVSQEANKWKVKVKESWKSQDLHLFYPAFQK